MTFSKASFIIIIPFINAIVFLVNFYFGGRDFHFGLVRAGYMLAIVLLTAPYLKAKNPNLAIYVYLIYLAALIPLSSNFLNTVDSYLKVFVCLMMVPIAQRFINTEALFYKVINWYLVAGVIIIVFFFYSQIAGIGTAAYRASDILLPGGGGGVYLANMLAYTSLILLFLFTVRTNKKTKFYIALFYAVSLLVALLIFRRSAIVALLVGSFVFLIFSTNKIRFLSYATIASLVLFLVLPTQKYFAAIQTVSAERSIEGALDPEFGRWQDVIFAHNHILDLGGIHVLIGVELFNYQDYHGVRRTMHSDYGQMIHGAGYIGLFLFLYFHWAILKALRRESIQMQKYDVQPNLKALGFGLITATLIISAANELWAVASLTYAMFMIGSIFGYLNYLNKEQNYQPTENK